MARKQTPKKAPPKREAPARYPAPDRSDFEPNTYREDAAMPERDLGARTSKLRDGRPVRVEAWVTGGMTLITAFFSVVDLEKAGPDELLALLQGVLDEDGVPPEGRKLDPDGVRTIADASGNTMYSLTFVVGVSD